jgi:hypothetical protein
MEGCTKMDNRPLPGQMPLFYPEDDGAGSQPSLYLDHNVLTAQIRNCTAEQRILNYAGELIHGPRNSSYQDAEENFENIATAWTALRKTKEGPDAMPFAAEDVGLYLAALKLVRAAGRYDPDDLVDLCGYAALTQRVREFVGLG